GRCLRLRSRRAARPGSAGAGVRTGGGRARAASFGAGPVPRLSRAGRSDRAVDAERVASLLPLLPGAALRGVQPVLLPGAAGLALGGTAARAPRRDPGRGAAAGAPGGGEVTATSAKCPSCGAPILFSVGSSRGTV